MSLLLPLWIIISGLLNLLHAQSQVADLSPDNYVVKFRPNAVTNVHDIDPVEVVFVIDGSGYTDELLFRRELMMIPKILRQLRIRDEDKFRFGLVTYGGYAQLQMAIGNIKNERALIHELWQIRKRQSRHVGLAFAFKMSRLHLFARKPFKVNRFMIVFSNSQWDLPGMTSWEAHKLQKSGVQILMVVTNKRQRQLARHLTQKIIYNPIITMKYIDQRRFYKFIINNMYPIKPTTTTASTTTTTTTSTTTSTPTTTVSMASTNSPTIIPNSTTTTRSLITTAPLTTTEAPSITSTLPPIDCRLNGRLVILIDASNTIGSPADFQTHLRLVESILLRLFFIRGGMSVVVASYGNRVTNIQEIRGDISVIRNIKFLGGRNNFGEALSEINQKVIGNSGGDLSNIQRVLGFMGGLPIVGPDPVIVSRVMKRQKMVKILPVGFNGPTSLRRLLMAIASPDFPSLFRDKVSDSAELSDLIVNLICTL